MLYNRRKNNNKNIICYFSFPLITQNVQVERERERERERESELLHTEDDGTDF